MKRKLLLAALCVVGALGMRAQTDVTSTYITNADFSGSKSEVSLTSPNKAVATDRKIYQPEGWNLDIINKSTNNMTVVNTGDPQQSSMFTGTYEPTDGKYMVRFRDNESSEYIDLSQTITINASGVYTISADLIRENGSKVNVVVYAGDANASNSSAGTWQNCGFDATYFKDQEVKVGVKFTNLGAGGHKAGADNIKIVYKSNVNGSTLAALIAQATAINDKIGTLTSEIETAQGVYDNINDTPAYQETIDNAISTLQSAINTKVAAYSLNPAGDDISALYIWNNGFDIDINFSSSSSTATTSNTVYPTFGWTPTVPGNCTGATIGYGYSGNINGSGNVTAPTQNADGTTAGGALAICVGWSGQVTYKSLAKTLPAGSYRITYRAYNGNTKNTTAVEAIPLVGFVPTSGDSQINSTTETFTNQDWSTHTYDFELASETEGQIQIGLQPTSNTNSYNAPELFIDEVKLTYFNPLTLAQIQWQEAWDALDALDETALPDAAETAITTALSAEKPTTIEGYNTAKATLQALIDSYDGIKEAYDKVLALITFATAEKDNSTGDKTTFATAISTATTNIETRTAANDLTSDYNTLETARQTFVTSGAQPTSGHVFDYTFKIPDAAVTSATDWTNKRTASGQQYTGAPDNTYFDNYNENRNIQKNIGTLRLGKYELKVATRSDAGVTIGNVYVSQNNANLNQTDIHHDGNTGGDLGNGWSWTTVAFDNYKNDKDITLGFYSECGSSKWAGADDFHLYYKGNVVDDETATALKATVVTENINATVASEQTTALNNFISTQTFENYNTLKSAIDAAKESKTVYEELDAALTKVEGWTTNATSVTDPMRLKYNNGTYSDETTDNDIYEEYQAAEITALVAASASNWTSAIINASFETGDETGWTATKRSDTGVKLTNNANYAIKSGDITSGRYMFNSWGSTNENDVQQTIKNLPAGTYTLAAVLAGFNDESLVIAANSETENTVVAGDKTVGYLTSVTFTLDAAADVVIKASNTKSAGTSDYSFIKADNFQLYVGTGVPASAYKPNLLYAINNATNARNSANEGSGVFQIPTAAGTTLATDIATAQAVYDNASATLEQINQAITDVDAARTTYKGTELNAPANDKRYCIKVATSEHAKLNNAVVVNLGSTGGTNPTGYTFNASAAPASYLAQAFTFTQVTGNTYKISIEMPAGTVYLTNGTKNGSNAGWKAAQIQGATDADNAMEFTIEAGDVANTFYIYNSETNSTIACQDAGNLYTQSGNAYFAVEEVSQASATMSIKADKWGTFIAPFAVDLPKNVKAYTVTGVATENEINYMVKEEVTTTIPANTPVVLKNNTGANVSEVFNGWGTAPAVNKTVGLLTGHYDSDYDIPAGSYVLQTQGGVQAFYHVESTMSGKGVANRCYLTLPNNANKRNALFFDKEEGTTGLEAPAATNADDGILYNVAGQQVNASYKGLIIKNRRVMLNK